MNMCFGRVTTMCMTLVLVGVGGGCHCEDLGARLTSQLVTSQSGGAAESCPLGVFICPGESANLFEGHDKGVLGLDIEPGFDDLSPDRNQDEPIVVTPRETTRYNLFIDVPEVSDVSGDPTGEICEHQPRGSVLITVVQSTDKFEYSAILDKNRPSQWLLSVPEGCYSESIRLRSIRVKSENWPSSVTREQFDNGKFLIAHRNTQNTVQDFEVRASGVAAELPDDHDWRPTGVFVVTWTNEVFFPSGLDRLAFEFEFECR